MEFLSSIFKDMLWEERRQADRIDPFLKKLGEYWKLVPDWRFGQLMVNFLGQLPRDPFFYEEKELEEELEKYFKKYKKEKINEKTV